MLPWRSPRCSSHEKRYPLASTTRAEQQAADQKLETGIQQNLTSVITIGGTKYTATQLAAVFQARIDARNAVDVAKGAYQKALAALSTEIATSKGLVAGTKSVLLVMFMGAPDTLAEMGLSERKTPVKNVAVKAGAIEKSLATRVARHTTGPKARLKVTGVAAAPAAAAPAVAVSSPTAPTPVTAATPPQGGGSGHS